MRRGEALATREREYRYVCEAICMIDTHEETHADPNDKANTHWSTYTNASEAKGHRDAGGYHTRGNRRPRTRERAERARTQGQPTREGTAKLPGI